MFVGLGIDGWILLNVLFGILCGEKNIEIL